MDRMFKTYTGRKYLKVAEYLGSERLEHDLTVRWFKNLQTGQWFNAASWQRPNLNQPLSAEQAAYVEGLL